MVDSEIKNEFVISKTPSEQSKVNGELAQQAAIRILSNLGWTWKDLENKIVLDVGAGDAKLAQAGKIIGSSADITSVDIDEPKSWSSLPTDIKDKTLVASAEKLPFPNDTFDLIVNNGSIQPFEISDEIRVLKSGGEIRVFPIDSLTKEIWVISYYLENYEKWSQQKIEETTKDLEEKVIYAEIDNDGFLPTEFTNLRDTAFKTLTQDEKNNIIKSLVKRYSEILGLPLSYKVINPDDFEPEGYVFYKKDY